MRIARRLVAVVTGLVVLAAAAPASASPDPFFPRQGNTGYDVSHYGLDISYTPASRHLDGTAFIDARATSRLARLTFDLRPWMHVRSVRVDGRRVVFAQPAALVQKLVITPAEPLAAGAMFQVSVRYGGRAQSTTDPDGSLDGWIPTDDGAFVASEPQGSPTWFPVNDTPTDKARYDIRVTVPAGLTVAANGDLVAHSVRGGTAVWQWQMRTPISSYLVTATLGRFDVRTGRTASGIPFFVAVDPSQAQPAAPVLAKLPSIVEYYQHVYGRYPFSSVGAIVDHAPNVGYALETATKPVFDQAPDVSTLAHELAHQWFGDDVTLARWRDIWLNEGFAEFSAWLWSEHSGGQSVATTLRQVLQEPNDGSWDPPPGNPGIPANLFAGSIYVRGAATLAALRQKLGDPTFFRIMRGWLAAHALGNAAVPEFTAFAASTAHRDLTHFFQVWLYQPGKPRDW